jgi:hypothetical protein
MTAPDEVKKFDVRIAERLLRKGLLNRKDYEKYLKSLPDRADNVAVVVPGAGTDTDDLDDLDEADGEDGEEE